MKKYIWIIFLSFISAIINGQTLVVFDKTSLQPLPNVNIYSEQPAASAITNSRGEADISEFKGSDKITISIVGYHMEIFTYSSLEAIGFRVGLTEKIYSLDDVVISASKFKEKRKDVVQQVQVIKSKDIQYMNQPTMADVMELSGNVTVQKSQLGGGSPIIRGFETNKVLIVVDGVRMNNAIYRGGHLQNIITLDNSIMDNVEIVFGPGSVIYGSDALGGVMHFYTKSPVLSDADRKLSTYGSAFVRYGSAASERTGHIDFNIGLKKVAFLTSVSYSDFGDLRQGNNRNPFYGDWGKRPWYVDRIAGKDSVLVNSDENIQKYSGYNQVDLLEKILFKQNDRVFHIFNFQFSTSSDIPRYDRLTQGSFENPKYAQWYYGPQLRIFGSYSLNLAKEHGCYDNGKIILAYQHIEESRHDRRFRNVLLNNRTEKLDILTLNADFAKKYGKNEIRYGFEGTYDNVNSSAFVKNINDGSVSPLDTRYPDGGSYMSTGAVYLTETFEASRKLIFNAGIRLNYIRLHADFNDTTFFPFPFHEVTQNNFAVNGSIGVIYMPGREWRFSVLGSSGFRAPNVDDLSKVFESVAGTVIVPNPDLSPENTLNGEIGISKGFNEDVRIELVGYYTSYRNAITTAPSTFDGQDSIYYDGELSQVMTNVNAQKAYIYGWSANFQADVTDNFSISSSLNYTYGRIRTDTTDYPLDHIPPIFGKTSLLLKVKKFRGECYAMYSGWKKVKDYNMYGEDNFSYATENGMPSWITLNVRASYQFNKYLQLQLAVENIMDQNYRVFASNISAPGRNYVVTLRGSF